MHRARRRRRPVRDLTGLPTPRSRTPDGVCPLRAAHMISYLQAVVIGLLQGVTELFPVSSLGHSVLVPAFIGGSWEALVTQSATSTSDVLFR